MEIELIRKIRTNISTIGELTIDGVFECFILEDRDRGLRKDMPVSELITKKVKAKTAIPEGRYEVVINFSNRFKKLLPLLLDVPAYAGIRIHPGNTAADTEGCLLPGINKGLDKVTSSEVAFTTLFGKMKAAASREKIFMNIK